MTAEQARRTMTDGLQVPPDPSRTGPMAPVPGRTYLSSDIQYSGLYARPYLFVIPGENLVDVHVDEDSVGEMISQGRFPWLNELAERHLGGQYTRWPEPLFVKLSADQLPDAFVRAFEKRSGRAPRDYDLEPGSLGFDMLYELLERKGSHPDTSVFEYDDSDLYDQVMSGEYAAWAEGGKIIEPMLTDWQKIRLLEDGAHVSHEGRVMPTECWELHGTGRPTSYEGLPQLAQSCSLAANPNLAKLKRRLMR